MMIPSSMQGAWMGCQAQGSAFHRNSLFCPTIIAPVEQKKGQGIGRLDPLPNTT